MALQPGPEAQSPSTNHDLHGHPPVAEKEKPVLRAFQQVARKPLELEPAAQQWCVHLPKQIARGLLISKRSRATRGAFGDALQRMAALSDEVRPADRRSPPR